MKNRYNSEKKIFILPGQKSWHERFIAHTTLQKKHFAQVICCLNLKFSQHGLFSAKKIKIKGSFIVGLNNFDHYLLEIETEEIAVKKIK